MRIKYQMLYSDLSKNIALYILLRRHLTISHSMLREYHDSTSEHIVPP